MENTGKIVIDPLPESKVKTTEISTLDGEEINNKLQRKKPGRKKLPDEMRKTKKKLTNEKHVMTDKRKQALLKARLAKAEKRKKRLEEAAKKKEMEDFNELKKTENKDEVGMALEATSEPAEPRAGGEEKERTTAQDMRVPQPEKNTQMDIEQPDKTPYGDMIERLMLRFDKMESSMNDYMSKISTNNPAPDEGVPLSSYDIKQRGTSNKYGHFSDKILFE